MLLCGGLELCGCMFYVGRYDKRQSCMLQRAPWMSYWRHRFFFISLDFGKFPHKPFLASCGQPRGEGGRGQPTQPQLAAARNIPKGMHMVLVWSLTSCCVHRITPCHV